LNDHGQNGKEALKESEGAVTDTSSRAVVQTQPTIISGHAHRRAIGMREQCCSGDRDTDDSWAWRTDGLPFGAPAGPGRDLHGPSRRWRTTAAGHQEGRSGMALVVSTTLGTCRGPAARLAYGVSVSRPPRAVPKHVKDINGPDVPTASTRGRRPAAGVRGDADRRGQMTALGL
jgi:hypothetical protein